MTNGHFNIAVHFSSSEIHIVLSTNPLNEKRLKGDIVTVRQIAGWLVPDTKLKMPRVAGKVI